MTQPDTDRPYRGRRLSWDEFEKLTGRKRQAANASLARSVAEPNSSSRLKPRLHFIARDCILGNAFHHTTNCI